MVRLSKSISREVSKIEFEEVENPYRVLGIVVTFELLGNVGGALAGGIAALA